MNASATEGWFGKIVNAGKKYLGNAGGVARAEGEVASKISQGTTARIKDKAQSAGHQYEQAVNQITQKNTDAAKKFASSSEVKGAGSDKTKRIISEQAAAGSKTQAEYDKAMKSGTREMKMKTAGTAAKNYYAEPWKNMKSADKEIASTAKKQFAARVGVTAAGAGAVIGTGAAMTSKDDRGFASHAADVGVAGVAAGGVGAGIAAGASMLRKL